MTDEQKKTRFREWVKAMPEKERNTFWRGIMAVVDAGVKTGSSPEAAARYYVELLRELKAQGAA